MPRTSTSTVYARWIGERLRRARHEAGLTQAEVASRLGTHQPYVAAVEAGRENLTIARLAEIASAMGIIFDVTFRLPERANTLLAAAENAPSLSAD